MSRNAKNCVCRGLPIPAIKGSIVLPTISAWIIVTTGGMPVTVWIVVTVGPRRVTVGVRVIVITVATIEGSRNHRSRFGWIGKCCDGNTVVTAMTDLRNTLRIVDPPIWRSASPINVMNLRRRSASSLRLKTDHLTGLTCLLEGVVAHTECPLWFKSRNGAF